jgi:2-iminoacetate synthase
MWAHIPFLSPDTKCLSLDIDKSHLVKDDEFVRLVAILRLAVPYTGMILTAREPAHIRDQVLRFGVSQIDGGTNLELGGYSKGKKDPGPEHGAVPDQ